MGWGGPGVGDHPLIPRRHYRLHGDVKDTRGSSRSPLMSHLVFKKAPCSLSNGVFFNFHVDSKIAQIRIWILH